MYVDNVRGMLDMNSRGNVMVGKLDPDLFPKVFGGGHAYLELTGEDLLETGVDIDIPEEEVEKMEVKPISILNLDYRQGKDMLMVGTPYVKALVATALREGVKTIFTGRRVLV